MHPDADARLDEMAVESGYNRSEIINALILVGPAADIREGLRRLI